MKTVSLVIPIYNEYKRINKTFDNLKKGFNFNGLKLEKVVLVDDGSEDGIKAKLKLQIPELKKALKSQIEMISYQPNRGRGYAVKMGAMRCDSDYVIYVDADFSIPLSNLKQFIPFMEEGYGLLFGSKKKWGARETIKRSLLRKLAGFGHTIIASLLLGVFAWDFQGGFKIFSKNFVNEVFPMITVDRWGFDMEVIFLAKKLAYKTVELPVDWGHIENGSKVELLRDSIQALKDMRRIKNNWFKMVNLQYESETTPHFPVSTKRYYLRE